MAAAWDWLAAREVGQETSRVGGRLRVQAPREGRELRLLAFLPQHTLRMSSLKIH